MHTRHALATFMLALVGASVVAGGNDVRTVKGESATMHGAPITTWAKIAASGDILEVGVTIPMTVIQRTGQHMTMVQINFPAEVQRKTFLNHVSIDWMSGGHEPEGRYNTPHFDVHYYTLTKSAVRQIDCKDLTLLAPNKVPTGWLPAVPPGVPASAVCVPMMGFHSLPASEFTAPGQFKAGFFDKVMIAGDYQGRFVFLEPMVSKAFLMQKQNFTLPVPPATNLGRSTLYPNRFHATFDASANAYHLILSDFRAVK